MRDEARRVQANHVLLRMRNVIINPHVAFNTREAVQQILDTTVENIESFVQGRPLNIAADTPRPQARRKPPEATPPAPAG